MLEAVVSLICLQDERFSLVLLHGELGLQQNAAFKRAWKYYLNYNTMTFSSSFRWMYCYDKFRDENRTYLRSDVFDFKAAFLVSVLCFYLEN